MIKHIRKSQGIARSVTLNQLQQHRKRSIKRKGKKLLSFES